MTKIDIHRKLYQLAKQRQKEYREAGVRKTVFECAAEIEAENQLQTYNRVFGAFSLLPGRIPREDRKDKKSRNQGWSWP